MAEVNETIAMIDAVAEARRAGLPDPVFVLPANRENDAPAALAPSSQKSTVYSVTSRKSH